MTRRVLHVVDHAFGERATGYSIRTRALTRAQAELGLEPHVLSTSAAGVAPAEDDGVAHHALPLPRPHTATLPLVHRRWARAIAELADAHAIDLIHAHSPHATGLLAEAGAHRAGLPAVYEVRGLWHETRRAEGRSSNPLEYALWERLEARCCRRADAVIAISQGLERRLVDHYGVKPPVTVIPNGVDFARFEGSSTEQGAVAGRPLRIGYVGSVRRLEGLELGVEAVARMDEPLELWIIGDGEEREPLRQRAEALGVADRVHLPGAVPHAEVESQYARLDVLIFPREKSPVTEMVTPLKPLEAMAMGKPLVASDVGGLRELIGDERCLFRPGDVDALVEKLRTFARDPELRADVARAGRERARECDWRRSAEQTRTLYEALR